MMNKLKKRWWLLLLMLPLVAALAFAAWAYTPAGPMRQAHTALQSGGRVRVETEPWLVFRPLTGQPDTGLILYPGGRVDARAYAPAARAIAARGYLVAVVPMPFNLAFLDPDAAADVIAAHPEVDQWAIGGHSLGGAMAARFARDNGDLVDGLALWAAYPAQGDDLSARDLAVLSVYGTRDGVASPAEIDASRARLPGDTRWVAVEGGNHAQFGWYGVQGGDNPAAVSREIQQVQVVSATVELLSSLDI
ncbi:MAG: alpha/beta hydrolase [Anaerolineae bacterium]|jgi:pimeloyl-ACP methyl ester carboxylesterase